MAELITVGEGAPGRRRVRPPWLRPVALAVVAALHGLVLLALAWPDEPRGAALPPIEVEIVPQGDPVREAAPLGAEQATEASSDASQPADAASAEPPTMAEQTPERAPDPPREVAADNPAERPPEAAQPEPSRTPPPTEATAEPQTPELTTDSAPTLAPELRRPPTSDGELPPPPSRPRVPPPEKPTRAAEPKRKPRPDPESTQAELREKRRMEEAARAEALRRERETERRREAAAQARERAAEREAERRREAAAETRQRAAEGAAQARRAAAQAAARAGSSSGGGGARGPATSSVSSAGYGAMVVAELNRRKRYPEAARATGAQGVVVVSFVIGPSGRVAGHSITRSSGNAALDAAVNQMMAGVSLPPPPGGSFRASAPVRFSLAQ